MTRPIAAVILAASMAFAPAAQADRLIYRPPSAGQGQNQTAQILGGLAALGVLGYAFKELRDDDDDDRDRHRVRRDRRDYRDGRHYRDGRPDRWDRGRDWRRADLLPARCLRHVETRRGSGRLFGARCLDRSGVSLGRLPGECRKDVRVRAGWRAAYSEPCLRQRGWRVARHR